MEPTKAEFLVAQPWRRLVRRQLDGQDHEWIFVKYLRKPGSSGYWIAASDCRLVYFYGAENVEDVVRDGREVLGTGQGTAQGTAQELLGVFDKLFAEGSLQAWETKRAVSEPKHVVELRIALDVEDLSLTKQYTLDRVDNIFTSGSGPNDPEDVTRQCLLIPAMRALGALSTHTRNLIDIIREKEREIEYRKVVPVEDMRRSHVTCVMSTEQVLSESIVAAKESGYSQASDSLWSLVNAMDPPPREIDTAYESANQVTPSDKNPPVVDPMALNPLSQTSNPTPSQPLESPRIEEDAAVGGSVVLPAISKPVGRKRKKKRL